MALTLENIENNPYQNLLDYLNNPHTQITYLRILKRFLEIIPKEIFEKNLQKTGETVPELATLFVELANKDIGLVKQIIHAYVRELKNKQRDKNTKNSTLKNQLKPIVTLFAANEIDFSWKLLNKGIPKAEKTKDRAYTRDELQTLMLSACDTVDKIIILLFSSAGFRLGAWDYLTWSDVVFFYDDENKKSKGMGIRVYAGDAEEYWTHGTPEAAMMLQLYREEWKVRFGKYPENSDPLIISSKIKAMTRLSSKGVAGRVRKLLERSGLHGINVQADNGFRKFFNTMCRRAKVFEEDREDMMGHYRGLQKHYERYEEQDFERFSEYEKAISFLTISDEERAIHESQMKSIEISELQKEKEKGIEKDERLESVERQMKQLMQGLMLTSTPQNKKIILDFMQKHDSTKAA